MALIGVKRGEETSEESGVAASLLTENDSEKKARFPTPKRPLVVTMLVLVGVTMLLIVWKEGHSSLKAMAQVNVLDTIAANRSDKGDWKMLQRDEEDEISSTTVWDEAAARVPKKIRYVHQKMEGFYYLKLLLRALTTSGFEQADMDLLEPFVDKNSGVRENGGCPGDSCILTWDGWARAMATGDVLLLDVLQKSIPGSIVEVGVWRGGMSAYLQGMLLLSGEAAKRDMWLVDSFKGLPPTDLMHSKNADLNNTYNSDKDQAHWAGMLSAGVQTVHDNLNRLGLLDAGNVHFLEGFIQDTLPGWNVTELALLRIDVDIYSATYDALHYLYPRLAKGGAVLFDDWKIVYSQQAVEDYRKKYSITTPVRFLPGCIDPMAYWIKE